MSVLVRTATAWLLLSAGCVLGSNWFIGAAIGLFLAMALGQWADVARERGRR